MLRLKNSFGKWEILSALHYGKSVQIRSFFWSVLSSSTGKYGPEKTSYLHTFHTGQNLQKWIVCYFSENMISINLRYPLLFVVTVNALYETSPKYRCFNAAFTVSTFSETKNIGRITQNSLTINPY